MPGSDAATREAFLADTTPFVASAPFHGESGYGGRPHDRQEQPQRRRDRRSVRRVPAILAAGALFIAGTLAVDRFGSRDDGALGSSPSTGPTAAPAPPGIGQQRPATAGPPPADVTTRRPGAAPADRAATPTAAAAPGTSTNADSPEVVYEVTASGSRNTGSVAHTDQDGDIIRRNGTPLPWRITFPVGAQRRPLVLIAQRKSGGDGGPVTCTITVNGKLLAATTADGRYAAPQCSGSG